MAVSDYPISFNQISVYQKSDAGYADHAAKYLAQVAFRCIATLSNIKIIKRAFYQAPVFSLCGYGPLSACRFHGSTVSGYCADPRSSSAAFATASRQPPRETELRRLCKIYPLNLDTVASMPFLWFEVLKFCNKPNHNLSC